MILDSKDYKLKESILFQDNQSAIKISNSAQKTRHMDIRYCWIADRLKSENISIDYCPTLKMLADFFIKPLQGSLF